MSSVNSVNSFFQKKIYNNLYEFALSPISWPFNLKQKSSGASNSVGMGADLVIGLCINVIFSPILIPSAIFTTAIAFSLSCISALIHGIALIGAAISDLDVNEDVKASLKF